MYKYLNLYPDDLLRGDVEVRLEELAYTRSGDKVDCFLIKLFVTCVQTFIFQGNSCNIGVIARDPAYLPYIREQLTEEVVAGYFAHAFEVNHLCICRSHYKPQASRDLWP